MKSKTRSCFSGKLIFFACNQPFYFQFQTHLFIFHIKTCGKHGRHVQVGRCQIVQSNQGKESLEGNSQKYCKTHSLIFSRFYSHIKNFPWNQSSNCLLHKVAFGMVKDFFWKSDENMKCSATFILIVRFGIFHFEPNT